MTRKLTDKELNELARRFPTHLGEPKLSVLIQEAVSEIRERRAADLSKDDIIALQQVRADINEFGIAPFDDDALNAAPTKRALAVLDRLLGAKP